MATVSFTKNMKLNKEESERLLNIIESKHKDRFRVTTPPAKEASKKTLDKVFGNK
ncbi:MAG: hypothetical protein IKE94_11970 [Aeriscardovia sp.]|nr:hypothetical protein [Aeriscardovia sp.]